MLTAYFDDSGTDYNSKVAVVAGYLSSVKLWDKFCRKWTRLLATHGLTQLRTSTLESSKGEFKTWDNQRRIEFRKKAHSIISECTYTGIGNPIVKEDFAATIQDGWVKKVAGAGMYGWCAQGCIVAISTWCAQHNYTEPIQMVFEAGTIGQGQVQALFDGLYSDPRIREKWHIRGWSFQDKSVLPIQAADVLAYECFKLVNDEGRPFRKSLYDLARPTDIRYLKIWDKSDLEDWRKDWESRSL